ncbi:hypothetical protein, partial [Rhizobium sp. BK376]|uniref:hypothetical protein n=1 Tax=Rhizobium sp. BK376 TaxID=2512149 RepID=UPI001A9D7CC3
ELHLANAMAAGGIVLERHCHEDRLLRLPITYDNPINDPRTNALPQPSLQDLPPTSVPGHLQHGTACWEQSIPVSAPGAAPR